MDRNVNIGRIVSAALIFMAFGSAHAQTGGGAGGAAGGAPGTSGETPTRGEETPTGASGGTAAPPTAPATTPPPFSSRPGATPPTSSAPGATPPTTAAPGATPPPAGSRSTDPTDRTFGTATDRTPGTASGRTAGRTGAPGTDLTGNRFRTFDANLDGTLTREEVASDFELHRRFETLDVDRNGALDDAEFSAFEDSFSGLPPEQNPPLGTGQTPRDGRP